MIRRFINAGMSNPDIIEQMKITRATFYNRLVRIRNEDYNDLMADRKGNLAVAVTLTRDRLSRILRRLEIIANGGTQENPIGSTPTEMINALSQASVVSLALLKLEAEGPTIVHTDELQDIMKSEGKIIRIDEPDTRSLGNSVQPPIDNKQQFSEPAGDNKEGSGRTSKAESTV